MIDCVDSCFDCLESALRSRKVLEIGVVIRSVTYRSHPENAMINEYVRKLLTGVIFVVVAFEHVVEEVDVSFSIQWRWVEYSLTLSGQ